ncbi:unnamed protein product, partial [Rotaria sp. Silwood2]
IQVEPGEYKISHIKSNQSLCTIDLDQDVAFTLFSVTLWKVALARNLNVSGDGFAKSEQYENYLIKILHYSNTKFQMVDYDVGNIIHQKLF